MSKPLGPYTPVVRAGDWIIVSGQLGMKDGALVEGGVAAQTAQAVENLPAQLASVGASLADVAKTLCFLTDMDTFATFNDAYVAGFGDHRPARSTIGVAALPRRCRRDRGLGLQASVAERWMPPCLVPSPSSSCCCCCRCSSAWAAPSSPRRSAWC